jgi:hypothetical protein
MCDLQCTLTQVAVQVHVHVRRNLCQTAVHVHKGVCSQGLLRVRVLALWHAPVPRALAGLEPLLVWTPSATACTALHVLQKWPVTVSPFMKSLFGARCLLVFELFESACLLERAHPYPWHSHAGLLVSIIVRGPLHRCHKSVSTDRATQGGHATGNCFSNVLGPSRWLPTVADVVHELQQETSALRGGRSTS